jgi:hypothetical protein
LYRYPEWQQVVANDERRKSPWLRAGQADPEKEITMKQRWLATLVGGATLTVVGATNALAADNTVVVPAPPSEASATALQLKGLLTIGETAARSAQDSGSASATALGVGGTSLVQGKTGGKQSGDGKQEGALVELEQGPLQESGTDVEVTPWDAAVSGPNSDARAALARVGVAGVVRVDVLHSKSKTTYTQGKSTGTSSSDGVRLCVLGCSDDKGQPGGLEIVVLHSEAESGGKGHSYVASIGDTKLVSDEDLGNPNDVCSLTVGQQRSEPVFLQALCVSAKGGAGAEQRQEAMASVANAALLGDMIVGNLITASGAGGLAPIAAPALPAPPEIVAGAAEVPAALPEAAPSALAATGAAVMWGLLAGLITLLLGAALLFAGRLRGLAGSRS